MGARILIMGEGMLSDYVEKLLSVQFVICRSANLTEVPDSTELVLLLHDAGNSAMYQAIEKKLRTFGLPSLRGYVSFGEGIIGPFVLPDEPGSGCSCCADSRLIMAGPDRREMFELQGKLATIAERERDVWGSRNGLLHLAYLIYGTVHRIFQGVPNDDLTGRISITNLQTLTTSHHFFLPEPLCPVCSPLRDDSAELACIHLQSSPKITVDSYRCRTMQQLSTVLEKDYLDIRTGVMNGKMKDHFLPFADVYVNLPLFAGNEGTAGRTNSYELSGLTAILEGLERYCGIRPHGKRTVVYGSYRELQKDALHPARVGLHEMNEYAKPDFPFKPFHPDLPLNWIWGYSFLQKRPILVPEQLAYYSLGDGEGFVYETSNGCALGSSLEEAIFHAILEVVERDSFLLTWYARLPLRKLDLRSARDQELDLMIDRVREVTGYDLLCYNSTMEHGIPSVWSIAKRRKSRGLNLICAAGAHLDPVRAVKSSIYELAGMMHGHDEKLSANLEKYRRMLRDPHEVKTMEDHGLLYGLPEAEERLKFLLDSDRPQRSFAEEFAEYPKNGDLKEDLENLLSRFQKLNLEVIVIDQSSPITMRNGLFCVKVLIPGMLPITFGYHLRRVKGLERVLTVPLQLGYTNLPLISEQLNPHPHPFP